jgi:hypothetical protein
LARRPAAKDAGDSISTGAADDRRQDAQAVPEAAPGSQDDRVCAISVSPSPDNGTDRQERLPGIAIDQWLGLWKDPDLYRRYLRRFARDYADSVRSIAAAEPEQAHALIHKLKGTAGTLGLIEVAARATDWEQQVAQGLTATLGPLQEALDTALASIARYAPEERVALDAPTQSAETIPREQVAALLGAVLAACDRFDTPAAEPALDALAAVLPRAQLAPLRQAIDDFDATAAAALTRALAASLAIELED